MSEEKSAVICVTCQRSFPDDLDPKKSPRYFAQYSLLPKTDDAFDFASETQTICEYLKAVADVMRYSDYKDVEDKTRMMHQEHHKLAKKLTALPTQTGQPA
jgi:hypothetical protein